MDHFIPADQSAKAISAAGVMIVTGVTLVHHSLEPIRNTAMDT